MKFNEEDAYYKPFITKRLILKHYTDYDIFRYYCGDFNLHQAFSSPLREDKHPSFSLYLRKDGQIYFNDFLIGKGDFVEFIKLKYNLDFNQALSKIGIDLNLDKRYKCQMLPSSLKNKNKPKVYNFDKTKVEKKHISIKTRKWSLYDKIFWTQYGITKVTLDKHNVVPISHAFFGKTIVKLDKYAYAFVEYKDNEYSYTIYQPYLKDEKWFKDHDSSVWYSWDQLPRKHDTLIITKSRKDIMSLDQVTGIPSTGLQNEKILPKDHIIDELKQRFETIYVLYDNDFNKKRNWGREFGKTLSDKYNLHQIEIPEKYKSKDFSDLVKNHSALKAKEILKELINK